MNGRFLMVVAPVRQAEPVARGVARGAVLLEAMFAVAIFAMAGAAIIVLADRSLTGLQRSRWAEQANEVARSAMGRIEAGIDTPRTLNGPVREGGDFVTPPGKWELSIESEPSEFSGLTRVTVTARRIEERSEETMVFRTLRQLVRLGARAEDKPGDADVMSGMGPATEALP